MKRLLLLLCMLTLVATSALAQAPPSLTDFMQFYGEIKAAPQGTQLKAVVNNQVFTTTVTEDDMYGRSPTFKVRAQQGQTITFFLVANGEEVAVGSEKYVSGEIKEKDFTFPKSNQQEASAKNTPSQTTSTTQDTTAEQNTQEAIPTQVDSLPKTTPTTTSLVTVCTPLEKVCSGKQVQVCSADGLTYTTQETCEFGCNNGACQKEAKKSSSLMPVIITLIGVVILLIIAIIVYAVLRKKDDYNY